MILETINKKSLKCKVSIDFNLIEFKTANEYEEKEIFGIYNYQNFSNDLFSKPNPALMSTNDP